MPPLNASIWLRARGRPGSGWSSLHADVGQRLVAPGAELAGVILQALRDPPFTHFDIGAMRLELGAAFARDIGDRADRPLEAGRRVVESELARSRKLVAVSVQAG